MKEIKVRLYVSENDDYVELWKVINPEEGKPDYFGRYTYADEGTWYYVCDPLGYCELDHSVGKDVMFIVCDNNGNEVCRYSNADKNPLPKFETVMHNEWSKIKDSLPHNIENHTADFWAEAILGETTLSINQWLLSFKDPDLYQKEINDMYGYDENWCYCRTKEIKYEPIKGSEFTYLGEKYCFTKVTNKHEICGVEWIAYECTDVEYVIDDWCNSIHSYGTMGNWFDKSNVGAMYDRRTARLLAEKALDEIYPKENKYDKLLYVDNGKRFYSLYYSQAAEVLLGSELHRDKVRAIIEAEHQQNTFMTYNLRFRKANIEKIKEKYPDIVDCCGMRL
jgi:hypothetical protein